MKRLIAMFFTLLLCAAIVGCGGSSTGQTDKTASSAQSEAASETAGKDIPEGSKESKNGFNESTNREVLYYGCSIAIPEYFSENQSENDDALLFTAETGLGASFLTVESKTYSRSEEDFKKEENAILLWVLDNISHGINIDMKKSDIKNRHFVGSYEEDGKTRNMEIEVRPLYMGDRIFVLNFVQLVDSQYDYFSDFAKIADSVKRLEE